MIAWTDNEMQFSRLIAELYAVGAFTQPVLDGLSASMDLERSEVMELVIKAENKFEAIKAMLKKIEDRNGK